MSFVGAITVGKLCKKERKNYVTVLAKIDKGRRNFKSAIHIHEVIVGYLSIR